MKFKKKMISTKDPSIILIDLVEEEEENKRKREDGEIINFESQKKKKIEDESISPIINNFAIFEKRENVDLVGSAKISSHCQVRGKIFIFINPLEE